MDMVGIVRLELGDVFSYAFDTPLQSSCCVLSTALLYTLVQCHQEGEGMSTASPLRARHSARALKLHLVLIISLCVVCFLEKFRLQVLGYY